MVPSLLQEEWWTPEVARTGVASGAHLLRVATFFASSGTSTVNSRVQTGAACCRVIELVSRLVAAARNADETATPIVAAARNADETATPIVAVATNADETRTPIVAAMRNADETRTPIVGAARRVAEAGEPIAEPAFVAVTAVMPFVGAYR